MPVGERKLIALLIGCRNLPPHAATGKNDPYISLRIKEDFEQCVERVEASDHFEFISAMNLDSGATATAAPATSKGAAASGSNLPESSILRRARSVSIAGVPAGTETADPFASFGDGSVKSEGSSADLATSPSKSAARKGSVGGRRASGVQSQLPRESVSHFLPGQKHQSKLVRGQSSPEYGEIFVFENLPIPLRRRSSSVMLNNSLSGGSNPLVVRAEAAEKHKTNQRFTLHVNVFDNTAVKGLGELICTVVVPLDNLAQGKRATMWVPLETIPSPSLLGLRVEDIFTEFDGEPEEDKVIRKELHFKRTQPHVGLVLEPINFGVLSEAVLNETTQEAILRALNEELYDYFSDDLIRKVNQIVGRAEELGMEGFNKDEMCLMIQELYQFLGITMPADAALEEEMLYLFTLFDKGPGDIVNISEMCGVIKMSALVQQLGARWRRGRQVSKIFTLTSTAGCLWEPTKIPPAMEYAGYRRPDGIVNGKTAVPQKIFLSVPYVVVPIVNMYNLLYGDEENRQALLLEETKRLKEEEEMRFLEQEARMARGEAYVDDTIPMIQTHTGQRKTPQYPAEREEKSLAMLFSPPVARSASDNDLPTLNFENLSKQIIEYCQVKHCQINSSTLVGCRINGGRFVDCVFECCIIMGGAEILQARSLRCSEISRVRITASNPVNSRIAWSHLRECELVAQNTLTDCDISNGTMPIHCFMKECNVDSTAKDGGANVYDGCRMLPAPKVSVSEQMMS